MYWPKVHEPDAPELELELELEAELEPELEPEPESEEPELEVEPELEALDSAAGAADWVGAGALTSEAEAA